MNLLTDWVNSLVCVTKSNGTIQLCLDPKDLNRAIKRPHHCTPTLEDILPKLSDAKYFSIVDARSGYWNIKLDHESSLCTNFNSPHGRHQFLRLPFGLICAQDIFQKSADGGINAKLQTRQEKQKSQYDKTSKPLPVICPDDPVRFLNPHSHKWEPGIVKCHAETPHSYVVDMADGSIRRHNRSHIRPTGENINLHESSDMDTEPTPSVNEDSPPMSPTTCPQTVAGGADREATLRRPSRVIKPPDKLNL